MKPVLERRQVDLLVATALTEEAQIVDAVLAHVATEQAEDGELTFYDYPIDGRTVCIATAAAHRMGAVDMGLFAASVFARLAPRSATLVGIAAAVDPGEINVGDVPFASQVFSYDDIAVEQGTLTFRTSGYQVDPAMQRAAGRLRTKARHYQAWQRDCLACVTSVIAQVNALRRVPIQVPANPLEAPHLVVEIMAGGPFLIRDQGFRSSLRKLARPPAGPAIPIAAPVHPKLVSAEMESHGFMRAAHQYGVPATVLKGISDTGDEDKARLEKETGGFFRAFACSNATLAALHVLRHAVDEAGPQVASPVKPREPDVDPIAARLHDANRRRRRLEALGEPTHDLVAEIRQLKIDLRRGGTLRRGDMLGDRYVLRQWLGSGGFATVWQAHDHRTKEEVAVKVLHGEHAGHVIALDRFRRGARIMAQLAHPAIVAIREECSDDDGYHFFVMDHAAGGDLHRATLAKRVGGNEVLEIIRPIASALSYAHSRGYTHRDVKPSNIVLGPHGEPYLTDFDLVTALDTAGGTRTGALGTAVYAAPEMLSRPQDAGPSADVYGLGMTAVFLIFGRDPELTILRDAAAFVDRLPCSRKLREVLKRCLAWQASDRYADASELSRVLDQLHVQGSSTGDDAEPFLDARTGIHFLSIPGEAEHGAFWISETPITNRQYNGFLDDTDRAAAARRDSLDSPAVKLTFHDAQRFCDWLSRILRRRVLLPTAAQWRYAAAGRTQRSYAWGDEPPSASRCHYRFNHGERLLPVGSFPAGRGVFGTLDQAGGVWEWCLDAGTRDDARIVCGGSFATSAHGVKLSSTLERIASAGFSDVGFRVVIALPGGV